MQRTNAANPIETYISLGFEISCACDYLSLQYTRTYDKESRQIMSNIVSEDTAHLQNLDGEDRNLSETQRCENEEETKTLGKPQMLNAWPDLIIKNIPCRCKMHAR